MKKTITTILTLVLVVATLMGTATTAFAYTTSYGKDGVTLYGSSLDDGYVTMDTVLTSGGLLGIVTIRDLFWTGEIGSAESSGTLAFCDDTMNGVTWTLKDGVLVLKGNPAVKTSVTVDVTHNSPFWNNEHIETIIIDANVKSISGSGVGNALFHFGLPNLKTVIFLGSTSFSLNNNYDFGMFPNDHKINYVWEACNDDTTLTDPDWTCYYTGIYPSVIGTTTKYSEFLTKNSFFTDRAAYLAAAAPIVANATLTQEAIGMLPADMIAAVNAIGGFKALGGNPSATGTTTQTIADGDVPATSTTTTTVASDISVTVNGTPVVWTDAAPFIDANNRTMVPLRAVADAMNLDVEWKADSRTAVFTRGDDVIMFVIGFKTAYTSRTDVAMDTEPVISNDRTYAPIRYLAEFFGYTVDWDAATRTVVITG